MTIDSQQLLRFIDLTSLNENDTTEQIQTLCHKAMASKEHVAAVCIYPRFIELAKKALSHTDIKIATVVNFPEGKSSLHAVSHETEAALAKGADEIDLVMPYHLYLQNQQHEAIEFVRKIKQITGPNILKVILETGAFSDPKLLFKASCDIISTDANFLKTSTGKIATGATPEAAQILLSAIKTMQPQGYNPGFKAAGGIRTIPQAEGYLNLASELLGKEWVTPEHFRLGASGLMDEILKG